MKILWHYGIIDKKERPPASNIDDKGAVMIILGTIKGE